MKTGFVGCLICCSWCYCFSNSVMNKHRAYEIEALSLSLSLTSIPMDSFWSFVTNSHENTFIGALCHRCLYNFFCVHFRSLSPCIWMYHVAWHLNFSCCSFRTLITSPKLWIKSSNKFFHPKDSIRSLWIGFATFFSHLNFYFLVESKLCIQFAWLREKNCISLKPLLYTRTVYKH